MCLTVRMSCWALGGALGMLSIAPSSVTHRLDASCELSLSPRVASELTRRSQILSTRAMYGLLVRRPGTSTWTPRRLTCHITSSDIPIQRIG